MDKSRLLDRCGALGDDRVLLARVLDRAQQAGERNIPSATDFLSGGNPGNGLCPLGRL